jgi:hypothetical protein
MTIFQKLFYNEKGEFSLTKIGVYCSAIGTALMMQPLPPVNITQGIGAWLTAIGIALTGNGALSKMGRNDK